MHNLEGVKHAMQGLVFLIVLLKLHTIDREISVLEKSFINKKSRN